MKLKSRQILLFLGDILFLYLSLALALFLGFGKNFENQVLLEHLFPFSIIYLAWLIVFYIFGFYDLSLFKNKIVFYIRFSGALTLSLIGGIVFFYLFPVFQISPKTNLFFNVLFFGILALSWRALFYSFFSKKFQTNLAIIGQNENSEELALVINQNPYLGYKFIGFLKNNSEIFEKIKEKKIEVLVLAQSFESDPFLTKSLYQCLPLKVSFMDLAKASEIVLGKIPVSFISQAWFLENLREGKKELYDKLKRISDIVFSFAIALATLPLWPLIVFLIKLEDRGPVFYLQERTGKDGKAFILHKFRSMKVDAERTKPLWAQEQDPRTTKTGKFLRRYHLDELPQLFNVFWGDLSLVGPRPERPEFILELASKIPHYHIRHLIKPGLTGWAQVKFRYGRSIQDSLEKFQYDLYYIKNRSFLIDLRILLKTVQILFEKK